MISTAVYDTLFIGQRLQQKIEDFSEYEIQFFAYFSCLLSLYEGNTIDKWEYSFVKTEMGSPFSLDVKTALSTLEANNSIQQVSGEGTYFNITGKGIEFFNFNNKMNIVAWRKKYLETACKSISLLPLGVVKEAIISDPVMTSAKNAIKTNLLEESNPATKVLYSQFEALHAALADQYQDLIVPAVVWLESLNPERTKSQL